MQTSSQTTTLHLERSNDERCTNQQDVIMTLHQAIAWVQGHMGPDQTADLYVSIHIPHDRWTRD